MKKIFIFMLALWSAMSISAQKEQTIDVTTAGTGFLQRMSGVEEIVLGDGITELDLSSFLGNSQLKKITFGAGIEYIDPILFNDLFLLDNIQISKDNTNYSDINGVLTSKDQSVLIFYPQGYPGTSYTLPNEITTIKEGAFIGASNLNTINITDKVTNIEAGAFANVPSLAQISVDQNNAYYTVNEGILYSKDLSILLCVPTAYPIQKYISPAKLVEIGTFAFIGNAEIQEVSLTDNVKKIGAGAFGFCTGLKKLILGKNIESIGESTTAGAESLTEVYCYAEDLNDEKVDMLAFADENIMTNCTLYVPKGKVDFYLSQSWVNYKEEGEEMQFFAAVKEMDDKTTGISIQQNESNRIADIYTLDGKKVLSHKKGLNILKMNNGTVKKVLFK